jgi:hypothetical protein
MHFSENYFAQTGQARQRPASILQEFRLIGLIAATS